MRIDSSGNIGIGTGIASPIVSNANSFREWEEILTMSKTHPAVKSALDKLRTTYYLSKENGNS
jgi:hypothetical protein